MCRNRSRNTGTTPFGVLVAIGFFISFLSISASARQPLQSRFGFKVLLADGWVQVSIAETKRLGAGVDGATLGVPNADKDTLSQIIEQIKTGNVEFYLDKLNSTKEFTNNVSVQLREQNEDYAHATRTEIETLCRGLKSDLVGTWGTAVEVKGCVSISSNGTPGVAYRYYVPAQNKFIVQYEVPFDATRTAIIVDGGTGNGDGDHRITLCINSLLRAITRRQR
jgi:hypothetical protein